MEFFDRLEFEFSSIPDEIFLFFYLKEDGKCFLPQYCFYNNVEKYQLDFSFEKLQYDLLDTEKVVHSMIQFYFPQLKDEEIEKYQHNLKSLIQLVDESYYSDYVKEKLCVFFVNYEWILKKLNFELISKEVQFKQYYERNYIKIADFQSDLNFAELAAKISQVKGKEFFIDQEKDIYISPCIIYKNCIINCFLDNSIFLMLGIESEAMLDFLQNQSQLPELDVFGVAVSEKNRTGIIDALLKRNEMPIRDIEKMFGISNTNAYYHLNMMTKAGIINIRNQGRTILYSLNRKYFDNLIEV
ncbi:ArsR/SmtB family transcription factor [Fumia xinanensis]|uniref:Winged helix-turn-helix transcriptional regulator n=1 Tax=Fumia xinanensis TaxID=2763659 RepID=A0A926E6S1_9FIRM|nr:winged helix-turn-helix domain-containing protein [Fumia xinanensis]MBC8560723.1 winged helix-turn-helix transcriptional regulator [Fumia xinanensis]